MSPMKKTSEPERIISAADLAYHNQSLRNDIFGKVLQAFAQEAEAGRITKAAVARRLGKDPAQISRWFSGPSNWTLDTVSDLLAALEAKLRSDVVFSRDLPRPNYEHPLAISGAGATPGRITWQRVQTEVSSGTNVLASSIRVTGDA